MAQRRSTLALFMICLSITSSVDAQSIKKLRVESNHSTIEFSIPISGGITRVTGKFMEFEILIDLIDSTLTKSKVQATIKTTSVLTGIAGRDEHLRSVDFFDAAKYPEITFVSNGIRKTNDGFIAAGAFSFHGVTREIELPFRVTGVSGMNTIGFSCRYTLRRNDYGLGTTWKHTTDDKFLSEEVDILIDFWTKKVKT